MVDSQLVSLFNQGSFPSCRAMQRAESQLGALWKCKSSWHIYIFCAPFAQIPDVLNNVIRSSPKSKAVCEITSLAYGIERMPSEKKILRKKKPSHSFHEESKSNPQTLKNENHCQLLSPLFWVSRMKLVWVPHPEKGEKTADQYSRCGCRDELLRHSRKE